MSLSDAVEIEVVLPPCSDDPLSDMLLLITKALDERDPERTAHGFLGGPHGYGAHWNSDIFQMRPFCWCEDESCPWCCGCDCPDTAYHYFVDGVEVGYREYSDFFDRETYQKLSGGKVKDWNAALKLNENKFYSHDAWMRAADVANKRRETKHDAVCPFCRGEFPPADTGAIRNNMGAPNFWHKPSGLRVWWYKYIGRGMEAVNQPADLTPIFNACLRDIAASGTSGSAQDPQGLDPKGAGPTAEGGDARKDHP